MIPKPNQIGRVQFCFEIRSNEFKGLRAIELNLKLNDICARMLTLKLPAYHECDEDFISNSKIINKFIDTKVPESTSYLKKLMYDCFEQFEIYNKDNLRNFCKIISTIVYLMHLNDEEHNILQESAEEFWEKHKDDRMEMEKKWFQPKLYKFLVDTFKKNNVVKEPELTRGNIDFLVFNIPIEAKCYNDRRNPNSKEKKGLTLLNEEISQLFQFVSHTNLGVQVLYDFRDKEIKKDYKQDSIRERIEFKLKGEKLIFKFVILRRLTPTEIKKLKD